jgi:ATP-dependent Clp protease adapter protein ClpS
MNTATETDVLELVDTKTVTTNPYQLVVWNDDVNTFEWVIETLVEVCGHTQEQAEQCAYIIHFNGKYAVKEAATKTCVLNAMPFSTAVSAPP